MTPPPYFALLQSWCWNSAERHGTEEGDGLGGGGKWQWRKMAEVGGGGGGRIRRTEETKLYDYIRKLDHPNVKHWERRQNDAINAS
jgi:hypothetical protein